MKDQKGLTPKQKILMRRNYKLIAYFIASLGVISLLVGYLSKESMFYFVGSICFVYGVLMLAYSSKS
ncbi:MAG: hypothetical protein ABII16_03835 [Patescibacteria group bacterium]|nr:hypothetical protein [Patescibacteria group bacterium]